MLVLPSLLARSEPHWRLQGGRGRGLTCLIESHFRCNLYRARLGPPNGDLSTTLPPPRALLESHHFSYCLGQLVVRPGTPLFGGTAGTPFPHARADHGTVLCVLTRS